MSLRLNNLRMLNILLNKEILNCFGHMVYAPQSGKYQFIAKLLTGN